MNAYSAARIERERPTPHPTSPQKHIFFPQSRRNWKETWHYILRKLLTAVNNISMLQAGGPVYCSSRVWMRFTLRPTHRHRRWRSPGPRARVSASHACRCLLLCQLRLRTRSSPSWLAGRSSSSAGRANVEGQCDDSPRARCRRVRGGERGVYCPRSQQSLFRCLPRLPCAARAGASGDGQGIKQASSFRFQKAATDGSAASGKTGEFPLFLPANRRNRPPHPDLLQESSLFQMLVIKCSCGG